MHKTVFVYDSAYTIVPDEKVTTEEKVIPIMEKTVEPKTVTKVIETPQKTETKQVKKQETKTIQQTQTIKKQTTPQQTTSKTTQTKTTIKKPEVKTAEQKKEVKTESKQVVVKPTVQEKKIVKTLTQKEEEIAWNVWRSNLQNKIMQDVRLPIIPNGIIFKFSFTVDMYGKITNVQTWSETPSYTPYAIQYIGPVIRGYQGKSILNFPSGTARTVTNVTGGWRISENARYSTPNDYNDIEKIRR